MQLDNMAFLPYYMNTKKNYQLIFYRGKTNILKGIRKNNMSDLKKYLNQQLKNKNFKKEWDNLQPEMELIRTIIKARVDKNITQKELSVKTGINQADISKFETGVRKPSLKILEKITNALDMVLKIEFVPKRYA